MQPVHLLFPSLARLLQSAAIVAGMGVPENSFALLDVAAGCRYE
jgi:hypothetical protein